MNSGSKYSREELLKNGIRVDGRGARELRPIKLEVGVLSRADGSAYIEQGNNKILVAVYGPRELHPKHLARPDTAILQCVYRMATFSVEERKNPAPSRRELELSKVIKGALAPAIFLKNFPRSTIDVYIQVLQADGGTRCASITAASLALADAGVPMRDLVTACAVGKVNGQLVLDPNDVEDKLGEADMPVAVMPRKRFITLLQMDGRMTKEEFIEAYKMAIDGCMEIYKLQRQALIERYMAVRKESEEEEEEGGDENA
ncbi:MAG: exosome complex exonuclease Rrp41 [Candidatus Jordarchaeales archaeon]|nr:exosome complex exonuclease Rrp41 [Candidatus Jordarchaeia archaeon]